MVHQPTEEGRQWTRSVEEMDTEALTPWIHRRISAQPRAPNHPGMTGDQQPVLVTARRTCLRAVPNMHHRRAIKGETRPRRYVRIGKATPHRILHRLATRTGYLVARLVSRDVVGLLWTMTTRTMTTPSSIARIAGRSLSFTKTIGTIFSVPSKPIRPLTDHGQGTPPRSPRPVLLKTNFPIFKHQNWERVLGALRFHTQEILGGLTNALCHHFRLPSPIRTHQSRGFWTRMDPRVPKAAPEHRACLEHRLA